MALIRAAELYVDFSLILPSNRKIVLRRVARTPPLAGGGGVRNHGGGIVLEGDDVTRVIIFTQSYRVTGQVALARQNRRLTDYMLEAKEFIAVIKAEVTDHAGRLVLSAPFLNVQRAHVEVIVPMEGVKLE